MCTGRRDFIPAIDCAKLIVIARSSTSELRNVIYFELPGGWDFLAVRSLAEVAESLWFSTVGQHVSQAISLNRCDVSDVSTSMGPSYSQHSSRIGAVAVDPLPDCVSMAIVSRSLVPGRSGRGRMYHPGLPRTYTSGRGVVAGLADEVVAAWRTYISNIAGDTGSVAVVVSYCSDHAWRMVAAVSPIVDYTTSGRVATLGRRLQLVHHA